MSDCERFAQVAQDKCYLLILSFLVSDVSSLSLIGDNRSRRFISKEQQERFAPVALFKRTTRAKELISNPAFNPYEPLTHELHFRLRKTINKRNP